MFVAEELSLEGLRTKAPLMARAIDKQIYKKKRQWVPALDCAVLFSNEIIPSLWQASGCNGSDQIRWARISLLA